MEVKKQEEIAKIRQACRVVAEVLEKIGREIRPGVTTEDLDSLAETMIRARGAEPVFLGYRGYPNATCVSVNNEIVHGIPGKRLLKEGDIVGFDVGARLDGYCGDAAITFPVGQVSAKAKKLMRAGKEALQAAIKQAREGNHLGDVSAAVEKVAVKNGFTVVRDLYGHGIGREMHEEPLIPNYGRPGEGPRLKAGMVFCIEPMLNVGGWRIKTLSDGWTVVTEDGSLSCHFEHAIAVTENDAEILTKI